MSTETPPGADEGSPSSSGTGRRDSVYRPGGRRDVSYGRRRQRRTRLLRTLLLLLLVAGLGGLASILLGGRTDGTAVVADDADLEAADGDDTAVAGEETVQLSAEQFESTLEREGVEVFRIRGARTSSDDQGNVLLKEVEIDYPRGDDDYRLRADTATYNEVSNATHLEGAVSLEGTNGLTVDTDWMDLARGGIVLTAADDSRFAFEGMTAVGDGLRIDFGREAASLRGGVRATGAEGTGAAGEARRPLALTAETLNYRWGDGVMSAVGAASMEFGQSSQPLSVTAGALVYRWHEGTLTGQRDTTTRFGDLNLTARSLTLALAPGAGAGLTSLEARGRIVLEAPLSSSALQTRDAGADAEGSTLFLIGEALNVEFDRDQLPSRLELSGAGPFRPGVLRIDYADGGRRRVRAPVLAFDFQEGVPSGFEARRRVLLDDQVPQLSEPLRVAASNVASGRFDGDGVLTELVLEGRVELTDRSREPVRVVADRATIDPVTGRVEIFGEPGRLILADGALEAPRTVFDQAGGCSDAGGGVVVTFSGTDGGQGGPLPLAGAGPAGGPSTIRSDEAQVCDEGDSLFRGGVEATSGEYRLAAAQLQVSGDRRRFVATGAVRTTWRPAPGPRDAGEPEVEAPGEEWSVVSERLAYSEDDGELRYSGDASASLGAQRLDCDELTIETAPASGEHAEDLETRALHCLGNVRLQDAEQQVAADADRAVYLAGGRAIRFTGGVAIRKGEDVLRGSRLVYWLDEGRYEMGPSGEAAAGAGSP